MKGKTATDSTRKKISDSHKGNKHWNFGKHLPDSHKSKLYNPILQLDLNGILIKEFPSINKACEVLNLKKTSISNNLTGRSEIVSKRFKFKYKKNA